jgi:hypothetical protein
MPDFGNFNISHNVKDRVADARNSTGSILNDLAGTASKNLSYHTYKGSFVGISENGMIELKGALDKYIQSVQGVINGFNENADLTSSFSGPALEAARQFITAVKKLLNSYVSTMLNEKEEISEAIVNYKSAAQRIASTVSADKDALESAANNIRID